MRDIPLLVLIAAVWTYWGTLGALVVRLRRRHRKLVGLVPEQSFERYLWIVWVPLVALWMYAPYAALARPQSAWAVPAFALAEPLYGALRWLAAACAVACLLLTFQCRRRMGADWRMDVGSRKTALITDGLYRSIRHPIYALSMLMMIASAVIVPTPLMVVIAAVHLALNNVKARNEERHLAQVHGDDYLRYVERTGRFFPRLSSRRG
jgi:protein-S-isoprenylcysteine O-methyltransferase Ste14